MPPGAAESVQRSYCICQLLPRRSKLHFHPCRATTVISFVQKKDEKTMKPKYIRIWSKYDLSLLVNMQKSRRPNRTRKRKRESFGFACLQPLTPHKQHLLTVLMSWSSPRLLPCFETPGHSKLQWTLTSFNYLLLDVVQVMPSARGTFRM